MEKWKKSEFQNTCVKIEHVTKRFGEDLVLKEVNLTLKVGQVYGVVGNNGSGKTVLMKCICGFLPVTTVMMNEVIFMIETPVEASRLERLGEPFAASETALTSIPFKSFLND